MCSSDLQSIDSGFCSLVYMKNMSRVVSAMYASITHSKVISPRRGERSIFKRAVIICIFKELKGVRWSKMEIEDDFF